jgi:hypothetical protein
MVRPARDHHELSVGGASGDRGCRPVAWSSTRPRPTIQCSTTPHGLPPWDRTRTPRSTAYPGTRHSPSVRGIEVDCPPRQNG